MLNDPIVITSLARTPMGAFQGELGSVTAPQLGAVVIREAVSRAGVQPGDIEEVIMGCVLPAGLGQAPARQASLAAGTHTLYATGLIGYRDTFRSTHTTTFRFRINPSLELEVCDKGNDAD